MGRISAKGKGKVFFKFLSSSDFLFRNVSCNVHIMYITTLYVGTYSGIISCLHRFSSTARRDASFIPEGRDDRCRTAVGVYNMYNNNNNNIVYRRL